MISKQPVKKPKVSWLRLLGLVLLALLLWQVDITELVIVLKQVLLPLIIVATLLNLPMIWCKSLRWQLILRAQNIKYPVGKAYLAYLGSIFIGLLTPGRLGEFIKAVHVSQDCGIPSASAFSSVLADRLFDLAMLLLMGSAALLTLAPNRDNLLALGISVMLLVLPLVLFLNDTSFAWFQRIGSKTGRLGKTFFASDGWLVTMRAGMRQVRPPQFMLALGLTIIAYLFFFSQCYLLAAALGIPVNFVQTSYAVALGSLVTLIPVSISGLGTREATMIAYLGNIGVSPESALGFSLLVFVTFYIGGGVMGAIAWLIKPVSLQIVRQSR
jgi:hypothetical protein